MDNIFSECPTLCDAASSWNILIVEDEPDNSDVLLRLFNRLGARVNVATNGDQALIMMRDLMPTFVLCDLSMTGLDGWALKSRVDQDAALRKIPMIALTAHAMAGDRQRVMDAGFAMYYPKPIDLTDFLLTLLRWSQQSSPHS